MRNINQIITSKAAYAISEMANGTIINRETLMTMLECSEEKQYRQRVSMLKDKLIKEHKKFLKTLHGVGYEIANRGQEINLCSGEYLSGAKKMVKAFIKTQFIDFEKLEDNDRNIAVAQSNKMGTMVGMLKGGGILQ